MLLIACSLTLGIFQSIPAKAQYYQEMVVEKRCGNCYKTVSLSAHAGQRCPHCGAYWGYEVKKYKCNSCGRVQPSKFKRTKKCVYCGSRQIVIVGSDDDSYSPEPKSSTREVTINFGNQSFQATCRNENDSLLIPLRQVTEELGFQVDFTSPDRIQVTKNNTTVVMFIDKTTVTVSKLPNYDQSSEKEWSLAPKMIKDITYVPLRALTETLEYNVEYVSGTITLSEQSAVAPEQDNI
jgi:DNA-directed RNA polymerase subunit RPC12/RpoP